MKAKRLIIHYAPFMHESGIKTPGIEASNFSEEVTCECCLLHMKAKQRAKANTNA